MSQRRNLSVPLWAYITFWLSLAFLAVLLAATPYLSMPVFVAGIIVATVSSVPASVLIMIGKTNWWIGGMVLFGITFYFWGFALRNFALITPGQTIWVGLIAFSFLLALLLPVFAPSISKFLWREQTTPETSIGKKLLGVLLLLAPMTGTIGAAVRFFKGDVSGYPIAFFIFGVSSWFIATLMTFAFSYQLWEKRPWKNKRIGRRK